MFAVGPAFGKETRTRRDFRMLIIFMFLSIADFPALTRATRRHVVSHAVKWAGVPSPESRQPGPEFPAGAGDIRRV